MNSNSVPTDQLPAADVLARVEMWCDKTGLHIQQEQDAGCATISVPPGRAGAFFDGLLSILVGTPMLADRAVVVLE